MFLTDRVGLTSRKLTDEGFLVIEGARIARSGIQDYRAAELGDLFSDRDPLDIIKVFRPEDEVFDEASMKSFENKPMTNNHPQDGEVNSVNAKELTVGFANNIRRDGIFLLADLTITDSSAVKDVQSGKRELSNGYRSAIVVGSGFTPDGESFDATQRDIKGNHVAIVDAARCGSQCSISDNKTEEKPMRVLISGIPFEIEDSALAGAVQQLSDTNTSLVKQQAQLQATHDTEMEKLKTDQEEEEEKLKKELDAAKSNEMSADKLDAVIDERMKIIEVAKKIVPNYDAKGKTCMGIKREILLVKCGDSIKSKLDNDVYTSARFEGLDDIKTEDNLTPTEKLMADSVNSQTKVVNDMGLAEIARAKKMIGNKIAWKFPHGAARKQDPDYLKAVDAEFNSKYGT